MKRDFALRIDSLLGGVRLNLDAIVEYMRRHVPKGDLSEEEFKKYVHFIGMSMYGTVEFSTELYRRSEERRVGEECRYWRDWSSDVCSSDLSCSEGRLIGGRIQEVCPFYWHEHVRHGRVFDRTLS